ncbi:SGNH/GDSL hydrolase family protein [Catelliglobosispora koreensis]|uniref:SGNH/GDSL hydrolase family protein n=1 Tax=Catelliglobosispora koreensis TaxID=129052 RepID=UPI0003752422|nr:SGNH/GDSL hydrolase family protein [Catelliglobosispora koreensis]
MARIAALGDSITFGMGDPAPVGGWRGWAALLAASYPSAEFRNFAASGALSGDVAGPQLHQALAFRPALTTVLVGVNDCLRGTFSINTIGERLHATVDALCASGSRVVLACLPEPGRMLGLPQALARPLARRVHAINAIIHALTRGYSVTHVHLTSDEIVADRRMWSIDRLHPSERGHRWLAAMAYDALARDGWPGHVRPGLEPLNPVPSRRAQAWWMATKGTQWLYARSTDLVPQLMGLAAHEWRLMRRGLASQLDLQMAAEVRAVLQALTPHGKEIPPSFTARPAGS